MTEAGLRVAVVDRAEFPRVKLCAGWLSTPVWDALEMSPSDYSAGLWEWSRCHVHFNDGLYTARGRGYFIRRFEFDHVLLGRSGAEAVHHNVKTIARDGDGWVIDDVARCTFLIGAGGTHCPVARALFPKKPMRPVGVQEHEFPADQQAVAKARVGQDGEPELLLHSDLRGYSWNVPKTDWLNVGCGTAAAKEVRGAWTDARELFVSSGHVPADSVEQLDRMQGHSYYLFHPEHLARVDLDNAFIVGDSVGLAQPLTAEGILPAIVSGRLCGEAIASGAPETYGDALRSHSLVRDYTAYFRARERASGLRGGSGKSRQLPRPIRTPVRRAASWAAAHAFAWMFSGKPLPRWVKAAGRLGD